MENTLIKEMVELTKTLEERLPKTGEGAVMILATDDETTIISAVASTKEMKRMIKCLLGNEITQAFIREIISEHEPKQGN